MHLMFCDVKTKRMLQRILNSFTVRNPNYGYLLFLSSLLLFALLPSPLFPFSLSSAFRLGCVTILYAAMGLAEHNITVSLQVLPKYDVYCWVDSVLPSRGRCILVVCNNNGRYSSCRFLLSYFDRLKGMYFYCAAKRLIFVRWTKKFWKF